jgi:hypothetical protein
MAFSDITATTMTARARVLLNEPNANCFTDAQILLWLNRATNYITKDVKNETVGPTYFALATGVSTYNYDSALSNPIGLSTLPEMFSIEVETIFYCAAATASPQTAQGGKCLAKIHPRHAGKLVNTTAGVPTYWYDQGSAITILPAPAAGQNGHMCAALWYRTFNIYNDGASLPGHLQELVLFYVLAKANEKLKQYDISDMYMGIFLNLLMFYRMDNHPKPVDSSDMMTHPDYTQIA